MGIFLNYYKDFLINSFVIFPNFPSLRSSLPPVKKTAAIMLLRAHLLSPDSIHPPLAPSFLCQSLGNREGRGKREGKWRESGGGLKVSGYNLLLFTLYFLLSSFLRPSRPYNRGCLTTARPSLWRTKGETPVKSFVFFILIFLHFLFPFTFFDFFFSFTFFTGLFPFQRVWRCHEKSP